MSTIQIELIALAASQYYIRLEEARAKEELLEATYELEKTIAEQTIACYQQTEKPKNTSLAEAWITQNIWVIQQKSHVLSIKQYYEHIHALLSSIENVMSIYKVLMQNGGGNEIDHDQIDQTIFNEYADFALSDNRPF